MPNSFFTIINKKVGSANLILMGIIIIMLFYNSVTTRWVTTTSYVNITDAYNQTVAVQGRYSYVYDDYITDDIPFEELNLQVPKGSFEFEDALIIIVLLIILVSSLLSKKEISNAPLSLPEIKKRAKEYLDNLLSNNEISAYELPISAFLRKKQIDDGDELPKKWYLPANIITADADDEYHLIGFNPYTGNIEEDLKINKEFKGQDTCPNCGKFYHQKVLTPQGFTQWEETFGGVRKKP